MNASSKCKYGKYSAVSVMSEMNFFKSKYPIVKCPVKIISSIKISYSQINQVTQVAKHILNRCVVTLSPIPYFKEIK